MPARRFCLGLTLIAMLGLSPETHAQEYDSSGWYLGAGLGLGIENYDDTSGLNVDTGIGFDLWAGYRFDPNLSVELQLEYLDRLNNSIANGSATAFTGNVKTYLETDWIQPFLLVGIGFARVDYKDSRISANDVGFAARLGGGMDFYLWESNTSLGVTVSYVVTTGDADGFDYLSLVFGVQRRF